MRFFLFQSSGRYDLICRFEIENGAKHEKDDAGASRRIEYILSTAEL
jgi:hypothetical protein